MQLPVYLDYAATTPLDPRVAEVMWRFLKAGGAFGNPASLHAFGREAALAVEQAREQVAALVGADPREIVWTSGATESDNLAITGAARARRRKGRHVVTCKTEHKAVLDACRHLQREGFEITWLDPDPGGRIDPGALAAALRDDTVLVSIMHVNNEIGVIQDLAAAGRLTRERGILLHADAAQAAGRVAIDLSRLEVDLMSFSAHKLYGPKGIGALYVRRRPKARIEALIHGGGHERGLRAGTLATHQIAGMGEAFRIAAAEMAADNARIERLRERFWKGLQDLPALRFNGDPQRRVPGIVNLSVGGVDGESLLLALDDLAVSSGSACTSASQEPSHVLSALGLDTEPAGSALRFSFGRFSTEEEIDYAVQAVRRAAGRLRALSPLWDETL